jgi:hypothetical protein
MSSVVAGINHLNNARGHCSATYYHTKNPYRMSIRRQYNIQESLVYKMAMT